MLQSRNDLRLAPEALSCLAIAEQLGAYNLQRHQPVQPNITGAVDRTHAAATEKLLDAELVVHHPRHARDRGEWRVIGRADHRARLFTPAAHRALDHRLDRGCERLRRVRIEAAGRLDSTPGDVESQTHLRRNAREELLVV